MTFEKRSDIDWRKRVFIAKCRQAKYPGFERFSEVYFPTRKRLRKMNLLVFKSP